MQGLKGPLHLYLSKAQFSRKNELSHVSLA